MKIIEVWTQYSVGGYTVVLSEISVTQAFKREMTEALCAKENKLAREKYLRRKKKQNTQLLVPWWYIWNDWWIMKVLWLFVKKQMMTTP